MKRVCKTCLTCHTVRTLDFKVYTLIFQSTQKISQQVPSIDTSQSLELIGFHKIPNL